LCNKCEIGTYQNSAVLKIPTHMKVENGGYYSTKTTVSIDKCIAKEIQNLWRHGVHTMGCCCGHNKGNGYIQVLTKKDEIKMLNLGYVYKDKDKGAFIPKERRGRL